MTKIITCDIMKKQLKRGLILLNDIKIKNDKQKMMLASVILFFAFSCALVVNAILNNSQAQWAIIPDVRFVGEYKIGDGEWYPVVEGEHIPATKGDVRLKGVLEILDPETKEPFGTVEKGSLMLFDFNHINLAITDSDEIIYVCDTENPEAGEDMCGCTSTVVKSIGDDGYFEAIIRNNHSFGNETAVDELLSSMKLYASDYSEKIALRSGQRDRVVAIVIIIAAFIVLGLALFSWLLYKSAFKNYLLGGLLILTAGIFFLFTSKAFFFWSDKVIVNTMMTELSAMAYVLFAYAIVKGMLSEKTKKIAGVLALLYGVFISVLIAVSLFSDIYIYDMLGVWAIGVSVVSNIYIVLSLLSVKSASGKQKLLLLFVTSGFVLLLADIAAVYFGLWQTALASKIFFLIGFVVAAITFLRIVPKNIKASEKAEKLEKEKIKLDAELAQSRISTLMSQIHPHFIYNTLGSIEQLCELDPPKAAKLVNDFAKYLRGNFGEIDNPTLIRVSKELKHTEYYISIEKVRFPDIEFVAEMDCSDFSIPALTIQPIVENAIKHGILKREEGGTVKVRTYETDSSYFVSVKDNGVGFDIDELEENNHVGLKNIKSRLEAMCAGSLHIESIIGVGTKITVEIPKEGY